ncbi:ribonuclease P protein subunit p40 isoform X2 [Anguilla rostrata]|uniref:ribonuclease P protein subunit p40 isoform X2 n=1 Tax=Anguilla rostrata TaxID=7938 RepID=UPI0030CD159C
MFTNLEKCPRNLLICEKSSFLNEKSRHATHVAKHFFNYKVSVLIPECGIIPSGLRSVVSSFSKYYLLKNLPVYKLLEEEFLEKVAKKGCLYALSYKTRIDQDNTFALLPTGQVILSVDKDTYEELGLEGKASQYNHRQPMRYVVTIDLTDKSMAAGGKRYKRVMWALQEKVQLTSDFLLARYSTGGDGEDLLQSFFSQYSCKELRPSISSQTFKNLPCPSLDPNDLRGDTRSCDPQQFLEWLGAVTMDISWPAPARGHTLPARGAAAVLRRAQVHVVAVGDGAWFCRQSRLLGWHRAWLPQGWGELLHFCTVQEPRLLAAHGHWG